MITVTTINSTSRHWRIKTLSPGRLLVTETDISDVRWLSNDSRIAMIVSRTGTKRLIVVNVDTGNEEPMFEIEGNIDSYSIDSNGTTVAYSIVDSRRDLRPDTLSQNQKESGFRVNTVNKLQLALATRNRSSFGIERSVVGLPPQQITVESPFTYIKFAALPLARNLSISPNGQMLFLTYVSDTIPESWKNNSLIRIVMNSGGLFEVMVLCDLVRVKHRWRSTESVLTLDHYGLVTVARFWLMRLLLLEVCGNQTIFAIIELRSWMSTCSKSRRVGESDAGVARCS